jgi:general secretion pathway protein D
MQPMTLPLTPYEDPTASYGNIQQFGRDRLSGVLAPQLATGGVATLPGGARVSADITTNSLVIVAPTEVQDLYARLIESLDVRRPQVMIDAKIVAIDTTDDFTLGVEFSGGDRQGAKRLFSFTSFGLSEIDPTTGALSIIPSLGFNGTLVDPDVADVVVQALSSHTRVDVLASPRILVNDNATGQLESVTSVPFESVNASNTIATTSLGGNQQAGTTITVTPHIKEEDHLQMEFSLEFSTFAAAGGTATLPPPRQIDRVGSAVTIPSGHTVIVGGLQRIGEIKGKTGLPYAEAIPILRNLTSLTTRDTATTSFFVFLRPVILRDERFDDLKYLSDVSKRSAGLPGDHPVSQPVMME